MRAPPKPPVLETRRCRLRGWREADLLPFAAMNADPEVMAHLGGPVGRAATELMVGRFLEKWMEDADLGWWALEVEGHGFGGFVGLARPDFRGPPAPCIEVGWRLARPLWGRGLATEAAAAALDHGFATLGLPEVVGFTTPGNTRSQKVMRRLGMRNAGGESFEHPLVAEDSPLRRHLVFRLARGDWPLCGDA